MIQVIGVVLNSNDEPVGDLLLSGAAQVGEVLTVDASNVSDTNGLADATFEYQWVHIDGDTETDIGSATGTSYTLTAGDEGKRIKSGGHLHRRRGLRRESGECANPAGASAGRHRNHGHESVPGKLWRHLR